MRGEEGEQASHENRKFSERGAERSRERERESRIQRSGGILWVRRDESHAVEAGRGAHVAQHIGKRLLGVQVGAPAVCSDGGSNSGREQAAAEAAPEAHCAERRVAPKARGCEQQRLAWSRHRPLVLTDVLAEQRHLLVAVGHQLDDLLSDGVARPRLLRAAGRRHHAVGAALAGGRGDKGPSEAERGAQRSRRQQLQQQRQQLLQQQSGSAAERQRKVPVSAAVVSPRCSRR